MATWVWIILLVVCVIAGGVIGFFIARWYFKKQLADNPPINEKMIRVIYAQMGRTPSEAKIREIMNSMKNQNK